MYLALKLVHATAMVAFLGNIGLALVWKLDADRSRDPRIIAHVLRGVIVGDRWITLPSAALLLASGVAMAILAGLPLLHTGWIWQASLAFAASGLLYGYPIGPDQKRMHALAQRAHGDPQAMDWPLYRRLNRRFLGFGVVAISAIVVAMALMIYRPAG